MYFEERVEVGLILNIKILTMLIHFKELMYFEEQVEVVLILNIKIYIYNAKIFSQW